MVYNDPWAAPKLAEKMLNPFTPTPASKVTVARGLKGTTEAPKRLALTVVFLRENVIPALKLLAAKPVSPGGLALALKLIETLCSRGLCGELEG